MRFAQVSAGSQRTDNPDRLPANQHGLLAYRFAVARASILEFYFRVLHPKYRRSLAGAAGEILNHVRRRNIIKAGSIEFGCKPFR